MSYVVIADGGLQPQTLLTMMDDVDSVAADDVDLNVEGLQVLLMVIEIDDENPLDSVVIVGHSDLNDSNLNWVVDFAGIALMNYLHCVVTEMEMNRVVIFDQDQLNLR